MLFLHRRAASVFILLGKQDKIFFYGLKKKWLWWIFSCFSVWRETTRWRRWKAEQPCPSSRNPLKIFSSPDCTGRDASGPQVRKLILTSPPSFLNPVSRINFLVIAKALGVWSASYTLWRESVKTVTCLNLSVATETPRLFPQRGLLLRASSKETAATCLPFLQTLAGQDSATHAACLLLSDNQMLSLQNKRGSQKSAAVQFVKKDWGRLQTHSY